MKHFLACAGLTVLTIASISEHTSAAEPEGARRYLTDCTQAPRGADACLAGQQRFLDRYASALAGDLAAQRAVAAALTPVQGQLRPGGDVVIRSRVEGCAWRMVVKRLAIDLQRGALGEERLACQPGWGAAYDQSQARATAIVAAITAAGGLTGRPQPGPLPAADPAIWAGSERPLRGLPEYPPTIACPSEQVSDHPDCVVRVGEAVGPLIARAYICGATPARLRPLIDATITWLHRAAQDRPTAQEAHMAFLDSRDVALRRLRYATPPDCAQMPAIMETTEKAFGLR